MQTRCIVLSAALLVGALTLAATAPSSASSPEDVSILRLIATPEAFDGKVVCFIGYVRLEFEGTAAYLHESDAKCMITRNALWLAVSDLPKHKELDGKYCILKGTFRAKSSGHMGLFSGAVEDLTVLSFWSEPSGWVASGTVETIGSIGK